MAAPGAPASPSWLQSGIGPQLGATVYQTGSITPRERRRCLLNGLWQASVGARGPRNVARE
eukprot:1789419-Pyramimonas_sp.AAC.1